MQAGPPLSSMENQDYSIRCRPCPCLAILTLWLVTLMAGCSANMVSIVEPSSASRKFGFLRDGETTKQEVFDRMGDPYGVNAADRALSYRVFENDLGKFVVSPTKTSPTPYYSRAEYSVTLIFDDRDILMQHSLVFKREIP